MKYLLVALLLCATPALAEIPTQAPGKLIPLKGMLDSKGYRYGRAEQIIYEIRNPAKPQELTMIKTMPMDNLDWCETISLRQMRENHAIPQITCIEQKSGTQTSLTRNDADLDNPVLDRSRRATPNKPRWQPTFPQQ